jgi:hypothetical protein
MKLLKISLVLAVSSVLVACTPSYSSGEGRLLLPPELRHCKTYYLKDDSANRIVVIACPDKSTTSIVRTGKHPSYSVVVG